MKEIALRDYQMTAVEALRAGLRDGHKRQILYLPTGAGKTVTSAWFIHSAKEKGRSALFVVDRLALVDQTSKTLWEYGIDHGIIQGNNTTRAGHPILVCSAQTLEKRAWFQDGVREIDLVVIDEAHIQRRQVMEKCVEMDVPIIGLSASPFTKGLGKSFSNVVNVRTTNRLIQDQWLSPMFVTVVKEIDTAGVTVRKTGEWDSGELAEESKKITGDIIAEYFKHTEKHFGHPVKTIVFSADVADGERITEEFTEAGLAFEQVSYLDTQEQQREKIERHRTGETLGLVSCSVLQRGYDVPDIRCMIDAHPYRKSLSSVIQQYGRGMRIAEGKEYCLLLDHAGNYLGFEDDILDVFENGMQSLDEAAAKNGKGRQKRPRKPCYKCGAVIPKGAKKCPGCGRKIERPNEVLNVAGQTEEVGFLEHPNETADPLTDKDHAWAELVLMAAEKKKGDDDARRWCQAQYNNLFGSFRQEKFKWGAMNRATGNLAFRQKIKKQIARYIIIRKAQAEKARQDAAA